MLEDCRLDPAALEHGQAVGNHYAELPIVPFRLS
jgi:hypothetical protein